MNSDTLENLTFIILNAIISYILYILWGGVDLRYRTKKKRAVSLLEVIIAMALVSVILVEITTFIVYAGKQSIRINQQEESFSVVSAIKTFITNKFNEDENIFDREESKNSVIDDIKKLIIREDYKDYIYSGIENEQEVYGITIEKAKNSNTVYICKIKYRLYLDSDDYDTISFILYKH